MISTINYHFNVTDKALEVGDMIAHDGYGPFYVYDGEDFLRVYRDGNDDGQLKCSRDLISDNLDWDEATFYRQVYIGNITQDQVTVPADSYGNPAPQIPTDLLEKIA